MKSLNLPLKIILILLPLVAQADNLKTKEPIKIPFKNLDVASIDRGPYYPVSFYVPQEMYFIDGKSYRVTGSGRDYRYNPVPTVRQDGIDIISNFPKSGVLETLESPTYQNVEKNFYIEKKAVTNRDYKDFISATNHKPPLHWQNKMIPSGLKDEPVVNVTLDDAEAFARWAGKRLPTYSEYQRAAQKYPNLKRGNPFKEWTTTPADEGKYYLASDSSQTEVATPDHHDQQLGFRLASY